MTVGYTAQAASFAAEKPRTWAANVHFAGGFDLSQQCSRVAAIVPPAPPSAPAPERSVVIVFSLFDELRRRAPVGQ